MNPLDLPNRPPSDTPGDVHGRGASPESNAASAATIIAGQSVVAGAVHSAYRRIDKFITRKINEAGRRLTQTAQALETKATDALEPVVRSFHNSIRTAATGIEQKLAPLTGLVRSVIDEHSEGIVTADPVLGEALQCQRFWCCIYPDGTRQCIQSCSQPNPNCVSSFPSARLCQVTCEVESQPWWCVQDPSSGMLSCVQSATQPLNFVSGPYATQTTCNANCIPTPLQWWCVQILDNGQQCIQAATRPPNTVSGPYPIQSSCLAQCQTGPIPWWCVPADHSGVNACVQAATAPINAISGPYATQALCQAACTSQQMKWWCVSSTATGQQVCQQSVLAPPGTVAGPFDTADACDAACGSITSCCPPAQITVQPAGATINNIVGAPTITNVVDVPPSQITVIPIVSSLGDVVPAAGSTGDQLPSLVQLIVPCSPDACQLLPSTISDATAVLSGVGLLDLTGVTDIIGSSMVPGWLSWIIGGPTAVVERGLIAAYKLLMSGGNRAISGVSNVIGCVSPLWSNLLAARSVLGLVRTWFGVSTDEPDRVLQYYQRYICQTIIPSYPEATALAVSGKITSDVWECWTRMHGVCLEGARLQKDLARSRLTTEHLHSALRRQVIDQPTWQARMRENGWVNDSERDASFQISAFIPTPTDLVRFLTRHTEDAALVQEFNLDYLFDKRFTGQIPDWAASWGLDRDTMLRYWRAHWMPVSPTQVYEMYRRLRPGRVDSSLQVDHDLAVRALNINDVDPIMWERLLAIAYRVPDKSDLREMLYWGNVTEDELPERLLDAGFSPKDTPTVANTMSMEVNRVRATQRGQWTPETISRALYDYGISSDRATQLYSAWGIQDEDAGRIIDDIKERRLARVIARCVVDVEEQYLYGRIDDSELRNTLTGLNLDIDQQNELVQNARCLKLRLHQQPRGTIVCTWYEQGLISPDDFITHLTRIGWTSQDALTALGSCSRKIADKAAMAAAKKAKQEQQAAEKAIKSAEARRRKLEADYRRSLSTADKKTYDQQLWQAESPTGALPPEPPTTFPPFFPQDTGSETPPEE